MQGPRALLLTIVFGLTAAVFSSAGDIYLAQSAAGGATGADCADALPVTFFNTAGNWGSGTGKIGAGTTVHLCGTISSSLTAQGSGDSGSPVTILFESGASLSSPVFPVSGALNVSGRSWITVDGGIPCGPTVTTKTSCNGTIQNTANGTTLANHTDQTVGINVDGTSNVTIQNMMVANIYVHTSTSDTNVPGQPLPSAVWANSATNLTIHDSSFHDANWNQSFVSGAASSGLTWYNDDIYNSDHCWAIGVTTQTTTNIQVYGNRCHDGANWDTTSDDYHHDGLHLYTTTGSGKITNVTTYNNTFDGNWGVNNTAAIFEEGPGGGQVDNTIYNNVFLQNNGAFNWNNGFINLGNINGSGNLSTTKLWNNTFIAGASQSAYLTQVVYTVDIRNNVFSTANTATGVVLNAAAGTTGTIDYNLYASPESSPLQIDGANATLASWKSAGYDAHSPAIRSTPLADLSAAGIPSAGFLGAGAGANLDSIGIATLDRDKSGAARPSGTTAWDIGAYEVGGVASTPAPAGPPSPPVGLTVTVQ